MNRVFRFLAAILVAVLVAVVALAGVEFLGAIAHPFPADFGNTIEEVRQHVARCPDWILAIAALAWGATALLSTWIAKQIGGRGPGLVIALLLVAGVLFNVSSLPYPAWFKVVSVTMILLAVALPIRPDSSARTQPPG